MFHADRYSHTLSNRAIQPWIGVAGPVQIVQFGDFECADCGRAANSLQAFRHRNAGIIDFSYKHFLAASAHGNALQAAEAVECARAQDQFWPMYNLLIANQDRLDLRSLHEYADSLGLDMARFTAEMDEETHIPTIRSHTYSGTLAGVRCTPTYFVDGILVNTLGGLRSLFEATSRLLQQRRGAGLLAE